MFHIRCTVSRCFLPTNDSGLAFFEVHGVHRCSGVANKHYDFIRNIRDAPTDVSTIAKDAEALKRILRTLNEWMEREILRPTAADLLEESLNSCSV
jgi:hypothetical protein